MTGPGVQAAPGVSVLGAGWVGGGDDGENAARLGGKFDVTGVGEVEAVVAGGGDEDDVGLSGGVGDAVEGGEEAGAVSGGEVGGGADGEADDVGAVGDGVFDALHDPAEEAAGFAGCRTVCARVVVPAMVAGMRCRTLMLRMVGCGGYADDLSGAGADGGGGERGGPGAVALLVLRGAVVAGAGVGGLVDFGEVEGEIGGDVGMGLVDAAVDDGDADAFAHGGVPGAVRRAAGDVVAVAADLLDGPSLRGGVVGVVGWRWRGVGREGGVVRIGPWVGSLPIGVDGAGGLSGCVDAGGGGRCSEGGDGGRRRCDRGGRIRRWAGRRGGAGWWRRLRVDCGFDGGDAEVFVALGEVGAGGGDAGFGVAGDGGVAIEDEVAVRRDAGGVDLGTGEAGEEDGQDEGSAEEADGRWHVQPGREERA